MFFLLFSFFVLHAEVSTKHGSMRARLFHAFPLGHSMCPRLVPPSPPVAFKSFGDALNALCLLSKYMLVNTTRCTLRRDYIALFLLRLTLDVPVTSHSLRTGSPRSR